MPGQASGVDSDAQADRRRGGSWLSHNIRQTLIAAFGSAWLHQQLHMTLLDENLEWGRCQMVRHQSGTAVSRASGLRKAFWSGGRGRKLTLVSFLVTLGFLAISAAPAQAATATRSYDGSTVEFIYNFTSASQLKVVATVRDTACNASSAYATVRVKRESSVIDTLITWQNGNGCGTAVAYSRTVNASSGSLVTVQLCAGYLTSGSACTGWMDNPYS